MGKRIFKKADGYKERDFLHFGFGHYETGLILLNHHFTLDSAGYLIHLGFELILKACHLHAFDQFTDTHDLHYLTTEIGIRGLSGENLNMIEQIDKYYLLRYPRSVEGPIEIGSDEKDKIETLMHELWNLFPEELVNEYNNINQAKKGGRVLMRKKKEEK